MELACDIIRPSKESLINDDIKKKFNSLQNKLTNNKNLKDFLKEMKNKEYIDTTSLFVKKLFDNKMTGEMTDAILMAYCISSFSDQLFNSYKSRFEQKLVLAANKVVLALDKMTKNKDNELENFYNIVDHYHSLYKIWKSQDYLRTLTKLFDQIQEQNKIISLQIKKGIPINTKKSEELIDELFKNNSKFATRILLHNYEIFCSLLELECYFWKKVKDTYYQNKDEMFIIIVSELKIKIIPLLTNPQDRKDIYYKIDIEDLVCHIRHDKLNNSTISDIINIFGEKITKINPDFQYNEINKEELKKDNMLLLNLFENFYNFIICK